MPLILDPELAATLAPLMVAVTRLTAEDLASAVPLNRAGIGVEFRLRRSR